MKVLVKRKDAVELAEKLIGMGLGYGDQSESFEVEATPIEEKHEPMKLHKTAAAHFADKEMGVECDCVIKPKPCRIHNWAKPTTWSDDYRGLRLNQELYNLHARITELERRVKW